MRTRLLLFVALVVLAVAVAFLYTGRLLRVTDPLAPAHYLVHLP